MKIISGKSKFRFVAFSLLWSLLLYVIAFSIFNWHELRTTFNDEQRTVIILDKEEGAINIKAADVSVSSFNKGILLFKKILAIAN